MAWPVFSARGKTWAVLSRDLSNAFISRRLSARLTDDVELTSAVDVAAAAAGNELKLV